MKATGVIKSQRTQLENIYTTTCNVVSSKLTKVCVIFLSFFRI